MRRNTAGQVVNAHMLLAADFTDVTTSTVTCYVTLDGGSQAIGTVGSGVCAHKGNGLWQYAPSQDETDGDTIAFTFVKSGAITVTQLIETDLHPAFRKNVAKPNIGVVMTDSTTHNPATGKTVTVTRKIDGGSHAAIASPTVTEVANGEYRFDLEASDLNGDMIMVRASATDCDDQFLLIPTST